MSTPEPFDTVLVVDFGAQYAQLIARRVREAHVYSEIVPRTMPVAEMLAARARQAIIFSGGPASVHVEGAPSIDAGDLRRSACRCSASVTARSSSRCSSAARSPRPGAASTAAPRSRRRRRVGCSSARLPAEQDVWMSHFDSITARARRVRRSPRAPTTRRSPRSRTASAAIYGVQFHPEVAHTPRGPGGAEAVPLRRVPAAGRRGRTRRSSSTPVDEIRAQVGARAGDLRAVRRRRLRGRGRARAQGRRRPAHVRVRRHRAACVRARASRSSETFRRQFKASTSCT